MALIKGDTTNIDIYRFWSKVNILDDNQCWEWTAARSNGYGHFGTGKKFGTKVAHRIAYMISNNTSIPKDMDICHTCDNPPCCNPKHLFMGTAQENMSDMVAKGRSANNSGENNPNVKISKITAWKILILHDLGYSNLKIAKKVGLGESSVARTVNGQAWRSVWEVFYQ